MLHPPQHFHLTEESNRHRFIDHATESCKINSESKWPVFGKWQNKARRVTVPVRFINQETQQHDLWMQIAQRGDGKSTEDLGSAVTVLCVLCGLVWHGMAHVPHKEETPPVSAAVLSLTAVHLQCPLAVTSPQPSHGDDWRTTIRVYTFLPSSSWKPKTSQKSKTDS